MNKPIGFLFPKDTSDEWNGFNDPGMEHFSGNPYIHLGKEITQNTLDAMRDKPAKIDIRVLQIETNSIPDIETLRTTMQSCLDGAEDESQKAVAFFKNAVKLLEKSKISVLEISDENTTGVVGPCINGKPYFAFMKATGQSKKSSDAGLGSFGIGKFAPFTVSGLRTVFVSTVWSSNKNIHYVQGKSILMSHKDQDGDSHKAVGYWGITEKCQPVQAPSKGIPSWLDRTTLGTSLYILGFEKIAGWELMLAASIAQNFFGSISGGKLEVKVGSTVLNADNLGSFFNSRNELESVLQNQKEPEEFREAGLFHSTLIHKDVIVKNTQNPVLGNCELRILIAEQLPKRVAILRDGMFITAELPQLKHFADFKDFVAVFQCKSEQGNKLLRAMEPPRHDDFEPQRLDSSEQKKAKRALKDIGHWVRDMLKQYARNPVSEETTIDELSEYFADENPESTNKNSRTGEVNPEGKVFVRSRPVTRSLRIERYTDSNDIGQDANDDEGSDDVAETSTNDNVDIQETDTDVSSGILDKSDTHSKDKTESSERKGGNSYGTNKNIVLENVRAIPISSSRRRLSFGTRFTGEITLRLQVAGADTDEPLNIVGTTTGELLDGLIYGISVVKGKRTTVEIDLEQAFTGAVRISAYEI